MADRHAGVDKAVDVTGLSLAGADAANYKVTSGTGLKVTITPRTLTASADVADRVYDGTTTAQVTLKDDHLSGDVLKVTAGDAAFADKNAGSGKAVVVGGLTLSGADAGDYTLGATTLNASGTIKRAPLTVTANALTKVYGDTLNLAGTEFGTDGLVTGDTLATVTLTSDGTPASAGIGSSPYAVNASDAKGGTFNPANYALTYRSGTLTVTPRPLAVAANNVVRFADEPNPKTFGYSIGGGGLVNGDQIGSVTLAAPADSAAAPGVSVFELTPSNASFAHGNAANYSLSYGTGLLVVLPKPPRPDEAGSSGGAVSFALVLSEDEIIRTKIELARMTNESQALAGTPNGAALAEPALSFSSATREAAERTPIDIGVLLAGDSQRITLPALLKLPLISFDPALARTLHGTTGATGATGANSGP
jgi:hypothetical protein